MGFITAESMEYYRFVRENKKSTWQILYEADITIWKCHKPKYEDYESHDQYMKAMREWYKAKPKYREPRISHD